MAGKKANRTAGLMAGQWGSSKAGTRVDLSAGRTVWSSADLWGQKRVEWMA